MSDLTKEEAIKLCKNRKDIHIGDQFILTISGIAKNEEGDTLYQCNQFSENDWMRYEELERMIPVDKDSLCYENGYRVGFINGYESAQEKAREYMVKFVCDMLTHKATDGEADTKEEKK